ncbi:hypothetical protein HYPSUDRAFT_70886 [Hypholoma sublateritium FD-334 SS-4]|uniref:Protein kinase domain-containing protein n=1 Tax=Hypholoma sublateritium (strain FD-334 SS-4) TaxID=945553 RepID=A0A0D2M278_HYPSF|nr:hypothetical protein HYPSUDRAFT_70886 [Hypholoma sublateritium FD-334 SS-4]
MVASTTSQNIILRLSSSTFYFFRRLHFCLTQFFEFPARSELPTDLLSWSFLGEDQDTPTYVKCWSKLGAVFEQHGFTLWNCSDEHNQYVSDLPAPNNYVFIPFNHPNIARNLSRFAVYSGLQHAARKDKHHYVIRVMSVGADGLDELNILRFLSQPPDNLLSNNHILPMISEIVYHDIVFGVFPLLGERVQNAMLPMIHKSTIEDVVYMIMQALEAVIYIHSKNVAHRDLFMDNFMLAWSPQSMLGQNWTRPRVYLIDFETAIHFSDEVDPSKRLVSGLPMPEHVYRRQRAPELLFESSMYCPFRLDMWQFGFQIMEMFSKTGIQEIDSLWPPLMAENPVERPTASEIFQQLGDFVSTVPPKLLRRAYTCDPVIRWM